MNPTAPTAMAHTDAGPTELAAQRKAARFAETLEGRVLAAVVQAGEQGLTAKEAREVLGMPVERQYSVSPRLSRLKGKELVEPTAMARDNFQAYRATAAGRARVEQQRCTCTHRATAHGSDRKGRPLCFGNSMCGCAAFTAELAASIARHPAGKARTDGGPSLREYLESKGEL